ncbi:hypothetical protein OIU34_20035 [Pararhizobium sp. BT-229]|uniref:hypothetical protein n=1 Tax=Pararhizobium sp. BT-229 TaxID=2986923 RepID=UPI0021F7E86E|nr:hypothetical protein [Pararhizobium sp. BT-229]MCV9964177.1 hypothetical protein [Pararhizobium sp. BT-229]
MIDPELVKLGADAIENLSFPEGTLPLGIESRKMLAEAVLEATARPPATTEPPKPVLVYRPNEFDDWGMIRNADGTMFATVRRPTSMKQDDEARRTKTDPYEGIALLLISAAEGIMSEPLDARKRIIELCAAVASAEKGRNLAESEDIEAPNWERLAARHHAEAAERIRVGILLLADTLARPPRSESRL